MGPIMKVILLLVLFRYQYNYAYLIKPIFRPEPTIYSSDIDPSYAERVMKIIEDSKMAHHWTETVKVYKKA